MFLAVNNDIEGFDLVLNDTEHEKNDGRRTTEQVKTGSNKPEGTPSSNSTPFSPTKTYTHTPSDIQPVVIKTRTPIINFFTSNQQYRKSTPPMDQKLQQEITTTMVTTSTTIAHLKTVHVGMLNVIFIFIIIILSLLCIFLSSSCTRLAREN